MGAPHVSDEGIGARAMKDINGEEFFVGDSLKVVKKVKFGVEIQVGDVVECVDDDGTRTCRFKELSTNQKFYYYNDHLQKL